jgi:hypothetical protein
MIEFRYRERPLKDRECYEILKRVESQKDSKGTIKFKKKRWQYWQEAENLIIEEMEPGQEEANATPICNN